LLLNRRALGTYISLCAKEALKEGHLSTRENSSDCFAFQRFVRTSTGLINRDLLELSVGFGLIMIAVWTPLPAQRVVFWVTFSWIISATMLRREDPKTLGLGLRGIHRSLWVVGIAILFAATQLRS